MRASLFLRKSALYLNIFEIKFVTLNKKNLKKNLVPYEGESLIKMNFKKIKKCPRSKNEQGDKTVKFGLHKIVRFL